MTIAQILPTVRVVFTVLFYTLGGAGELDT